MSGHPGKNWPVLKRIETLSENFQDPPLQNITLSAHYLMCMCSFWWDSCWIKYKQNDDDDDNDNDDNRGGGVGDFRL